MTVSQEPLKIGVAPKPGEQLIVSGQSAYKIIRGQTASGEWIEAPSYMFPYQSVGGTPLTYRSTATVGRNVETGGGFTEPAGTGDYGQTAALQLAQKYAPGGFFAQEYQTSQARDIAIEQKIAQEQAQLKSGFGGIFPTEYSQRMAAAPIGTLIPTQSQYEQLRYLQSGTAQWSTPESFKSAVSGIEKYSAFAGVSEFRGTILTPQSYAPIPSPFKMGFVDYAAGSPFGTGYFTSPEYQGQSQRQLPSYLFGRSEDEFRVLSPYGQLLPGDISAGLQQRRTEQTYKSLLPADIGLSPFSSSFYKGATDISEGIRGFTIGTGGLPKEIRESPGMALGTFVFQKGRESTARLSEFVGTIPGTVEIFGKTAISKPAALPSMAVYGGLAVATGIGKQAISEPFQLLSDVFVTTGAFKLAGKGISGIRGSMKDLMPSFRSTSGKELYTTETGMRGIRPSELRTVDLMSEPIKPIFPETEGTPLPRATYPYSMAYAEKITYPVSSKFQVIGKGLKYEVWGEKPISPTEYFGSITRGRFMLERDVFGTDKIFGGRYRKGEVDPWAGKPTMRQSAEMRGETLKRTITEYKPKEIKVFGGTELKYGTQSMIAVMEEPQPISKTVQVQKTSLFPLSISKTRAITKTIALNMPKTRQMTFNLQTQRTGFKPISIQKSVQAQVSRFAVGYSTKPITTPRITTRQIYRMETAFKPIQRTVAIEMPITVKIQKQKTSSIDVFPSMRRRGGKRSAFKFPELSRVAAPRDIMKGMFSTSTKRRKSRKGKR